MGNLVSKSNLKNILKGVVEYIRGLLRDLYDKIEEEIQEVIRSIPKVDWNENDPTHRDYIKNRTHYVARDESYEVVDSDPFEVDVFPRTIYGTKNLPGVVIPDGSVPAKTILIGNNLGTTGIRNAAFLGHHELEGYISEGELQDVSLTLQPVSVSSNFVEGYEQYTILSIGVEVLAGWFGNEYAFSEINIPMSFKTVGVLVKRILELHPTAQLTPVENKNIVELSAIEDTYDSFLNTLFTYAYYVLEDDSDDSRAIVAEGTKNSTYVPIIMGNFITNHGIVDNMPNGTEGYEGYYHDDFIYEQKYVGVDLSFTNNWEDFTDFIEVVGNNLYAIEFLWKGETILTYEESGVDFLTARECTYYSELVETLDQKYLPPYIQEAQYNQDIADIYHTFLSYVNAGDYNSSNHMIELKNGNTVLFSIDATPFLIDGMVSNVEVKDVEIQGEEVKCLVITFNTDAGKQDINIPLTLIFDPDLYYTKEEVYNKEEIDANIYNKVQSDARYAYKTITIEGTGGLTGGGSLAENRTIDLTQRSKQSLALADSAVQPEDITSIPFIHTDMEADTFKYLVRSLIHDGASGMDPEDYAALTEFIQNYLDDIEDGETALVELLRDEIPGKLVYVYKDDYEGLFKIIWNEFEDDHTFVTNIVLHYDVDPQTSAIVPIDTDSVVYVIHVDTALSNSSTNPVENRVIKGAIDNLQQDIDNLSDLIGFDDSDFNDDFNDDFGSATVRTRIENLEVKVEALENNLFVLDINIPGNREFQTPNDLLQFLGITLNEWANLAHYGVIRGTSNGKKYTYLIKEVSSNFIHLYRLDTDLPSGVNKICQQTIELVDNVYKCVYVEKEIVTKATISNMLTALQNASIIGGYTMLLNNETGEYDFTFIAP